MKLYDNDAYREEFMELVYGLLMSDGTNDRANQIIDAFDMAPVVEAEPTPPAVPLTLEQLREMDGEPLWIRNHCTGAYTCRVIYSSDSNFTHFTDGGLLENRSYDLYWTAYRRRPEEGYDGTAD